ncbi:MAG: type II toxin-antitoxin system RelE/ParE family toxin [Lactobacillales bacterium]|jgi:mRNA interferase RelE/StbE|nr:type II toxin-antitoxin system RelE/ParE family toxin [Lactobacillales bacterium]
MSYNLEFSKKFDKQIDKLDKSISTKILKYLINNLDGCQNPRNLGKALVGNKAGKWRYRVGNYRVITLIEDEKLVVLALEVAHRKDIYK